jgi:hypothetical protein
MSRILKRPMFRIGGSTNEGVVSMAVPRGQYANSNYEQLMSQYPQSKDLISDAESRAALMSAFAGSGRSRDDRLSDLLISGGLNLMSARPSGGIFSTAASAFKEPTSQYLKGAAEEDSFQRQLKLAGLTSAMTTQENREKYKKELDIAKQQLRQKDKELYISTSSDKSRAYHLFDTLENFESKGNKVIKSEVPLIGGGKVKTPDPKILLRIPKDTIFPGSDGALYQKTDNIKGFKIITESGTEPDKPPVTDKKTTAWERLSSLSDKGVDASRYGNYMTGYSQGGTVDKQSGITNLDPRPWTKNSFYEKLLEADKNNKGTG